MVIHRIWGQPAGTGTILHNRPMEDIGVYSLRALERSGHQRSDIRDLIKGGQLQKICRGWYATPDADQRIVGQIQNGVRIGCLTGCKFHGLWVPPFSGTHVTYRTGTKPQSASRTVVHRYDAPLSDTVVWDIHDCLRQVLRAHDPETALVVLESAVHIGLIRSYEAHTLIKDAPRRSQHLSRHLSNTESGSETRASYFFRARGVKVRNQVEIPTVGRVDILVGDRLIVECDSDRFHATQESYENDRRRDLAAIDLGYETTRLSYSQIWDRWEATKQSLLIQIRNNRHRWPR